MPASQPYARTHTNQHTHAYEFDQINISPGRVGTRQPPKKGESGAGGSPISKLPVASASVGDGKLITNNICCFAAAVQPSP